MTDVKKMFLLQKDLLGQKMSSQGYNNTEGIWWWQPLKIFHNIILNLQDMIKSHLTIGTVPTLSSQPKDWGLLMNIIILTNVYLLPIGSQEKFITLNQMNKMF